MKAKRDWYNPSVKCLKRPHNSGRSGKGRVHSRRRSTYRRK